MDKTKIFSIVCVIILVVSLIRNFNFKLYKFEPFWQSIVYFLALCIGIWLIFRKYKK
jgi:ABC-type nickel/cobalt efflux system permease component RcnA